ncbi:glycosyltransferase family 2 protein [Patescibacteria group bacterium]|nr:glycosyltransferase family 2 protein [Patescibacteria group bacterium]
MKKVAIIIVNYNGRKYLPELLGSIFDYGPKTVNQQIIIVDNNSADDSVDFIKKKYPQVGLLPQAKNVGFARGNNIGINYAGERGFDYVMLLNQDTIITQGYLDELVSKIEADNRIAAVQPKLLLYPEKDLINSLGNVIHYLGFGYTCGHRKKIQDTRYENQKVNYCSGAACLIKMEALKKIGLFNDDLFMYHEDLDLGWRIRMAGFQNIIVPEAVVYHQYEFSRSIKKYYYMERNRYIVLFQNYKCGTIILILPALIVMELGLFMMSFINGWRQEKIKVYFYFLNPVSWLKILKQRKKIQSSRTKKDKEVVGDFSGRIEHQEIDNRLVRLINPLFNLYWQIVKRLIIW